MERLTKQGKKVVSKLPDLTKLRMKFYKLKVHFTNARLLTFAMFFAILWLLLELLARIYDFYRWAPWIDIPSHLLAGVALAAFVTWFLYQSRYKGKNILILAWVIIVSIVFELGEMGEQLIFPNQPLYLWDYFFWDGFWDIIMAIVGGLIFILLFKYRLKYKLKVV